MFPAIFRNYFGSVNIYGTFPETLKNGPQFKLGHVQLPTIDLKYLNLIKNVKDIFVFTVCNKNHQQIKHEYLIRHRGYTEPMPNKFKE